MGEFFLVFLVIVIVVHICIIAANNEKIRKEKEYKRKMQEYGRILFLENLYITKNLKAIG